MQNPAASMYLRASASVETRLGHWISPPRLSSGSHRARQEKLTTQDANRTRLSTPPPPTIQAVRRSRSNYQITTVSRYSPKARRKASEISPTVAYASTAARIPGMRFSVVRARRSTSSSAACDLAESRRARRAFSRAIRERSISGSMRIVGMDCSSGGLKAIDAHDHLFAALHGLLIFVRGLLNLHLKIAGLDCPEHSSQRVNLRNIGPARPFRFRWSASRWRRSPRPGPRYWRRPFPGR